MFNRKEKSDTEPFPSPQVFFIQGIGSRENQQDSVFVSEADKYSQQGIMMCLADGMGGLEDGERISKTAVSAVSNTFAVSDKNNTGRLLIAMLKSAVSSVNALVCPNYSSGGTTLLLGYAKDGRFYYASVGDSRIYMFRDGDILQLNRQHTLESELLLHTVNGAMRYDDAVDYEKKGALTSYLGMGGLKYADIPLAPVNIRNGDRFALMSDGVFNTIPDGELAEIFSNDPEKICEAAAAFIEDRKYPGQDNYSLAFVAF